MNLNKKTITNSIIDYGDTSEFSGYNENLDIKNNDLDCSAYSGMSGYPGEKNE